MQCSEASSISSGTNHNDSDDEDFHDASADLGHLHLSDDIHENSTETYADAADFLLENDNQFKTPTGSNCNYSASTTEKTNKKLHERLNESSEEEEEEENTTDSETVIESVDPEEDEMKLKEQDWSDDEKKAKKKEANDLKVQGNTAFKEQLYTAAETLYTQALATCPSCFSNERSVMYANRAACKLRKDEDSAAIEDCTRALRLNPRYVKCLLRRAELYEKTDKLDESLADYKAVWEIDRSIHEAAASCIRLEQAINERNEKLKEEMMGKLKDLGNMVLKPFGLSTNNFQLQQNPETGGYNVNFQR